MIVRHDVIEAERIEQPFLVLIEPPHHRSPPSIAASTRGNQRSETSAPILWSHGTGSEVMQRIAVPMIGGMVSSTVLTLIVIPAVYALVKGIGLKRAPAPAVAMAE